MKTVFFTSDEAVRQVADNLKDYDVFYSHEPEKIINEIKGSEDNVFLFLDFDIGINLAEDLNQQFMEKQNVCRIILTSKLDSVALKKHQFSENSADGYIIKPIITQFIESSLDDYLAASENPWPQSTISASFEDMTFIGRAKTKITKIMPLDEETDSKTEDLTAPSKITESAINANELQNITPDKDDAFVLEDQTESIIKESDEINLADEIKVDDSFELPSLESGNEDISVESNSDALNLDELNELSASKDALESNSIDLNVGDLNISNSLESGTRESNSNDEINLDSGSNELPDIEENNSELETTNSVVQSDLDVGLSIGDIDLSLGDGPSIEEKEFKTNEIDTSLEDVDFTAINTW